MEIKGIHIDLKAQTMRFDYLLRVIEDIAKMGFNTILLEYQDKFPYSADLSVFSAPDALTVREIEKLKCACGKRGIRIIPLVQCLGHMYWVTRHRPYDRLGEHFSEKGRGSHSLCASREESIELFRQLAREVMKLHPDCTYFHIGGDEVKFSEDCPYCKGKSKSQILGSYYREALAYVKEQGYTPVMWGDMVVKYQEVCDYIPKDTVMMDWEYCKGLSKANAGRFYKDAPPMAPVDDSSFACTKELMEKGFEVLCAPSVRSMGDCMFIPRCGHLDNCVQAWYTAKDLNTKGFVVTSWSVRRVPWELTKHILAAVSLLMKEEEADYQDTLCFCAERCFGTTDPEIAKIPYQLAAAAEEAMGTVNVIASGNDFMDPETGMFLADPLEKRPGGAQLLHNKEAQEAYTRLYQTAEELLAKLSGNVCLTFETQMLIWALEQAVFYGKWISKLCDRGDDAEAQKELERKLKCLQKQVNSLQELYTDFSMPGEYQTRVEVYREYLQKLF